MGVLVADRSGNAGTFPRAAAGARAAAGSAAGPLPGHAGVTIRHLAAAPPLVPVDAGKVAVVLVDARGARVRVGAAPPRRRRGARARRRATARACACACRAASRACTS